MPTLSHDAISLQLEWKMKPHDKGQRGDRKKDWCSNQRTQRWAQHKGLLTQHPPTPPPSEDERGIKTEKIQVQNTRNLLGGMTNYNRVSSRPETFRPVLRRLPLFSAFSVFVSSFYGNVPSFSPGFCWVLSYSHLFPFTPLLALPMAKVDIFGQLPNI